MKKKFLSVFVVVTIALLLFVLVDLQLIKTENVSTKKSNVVEQRKKELHLIHIPKTTDTFIEYIGERSGIEWSMVWFNKRNGFYKWNETIIDKYESPPLCNQRYHLPPRTFKSSFDYYNKNKYSFFCVIRDPYSRIFSEYLWNIWWNEYNHINYNNINYCDADVMNNIINTWLRDAIHEKKELFFNNRGCHLLPQYLYIFDSNETTKICDNIINRTNVLNLVPQLKKLFIDYNYAIKYKNLTCDLENLPKRQQLCKYKLNINNFTTETIYNINVLYKNDFELLNFSKIAINSKIQKEMIWIQNAGLKYKEYYFKQYPDNFTVLKNHKNKCKILAIEKNQSIFHQNRQQILPYNPPLYKKQNQSKRRALLLQNNIDMVTMVLCVRLRNELRYLFEWIEYHHFLQGIDYIWILDHYSVDRLHLLPNIYGNSSWLSIFKISGEGQGYKICLSRAKQLNITFVGLWDVDEFVYPINHSLNIKQYLSNFIIPNNINQIHIVLHGYGTYTDDTPFNYDINPQNTSAIINGNSEGIKTVIGRYLYTYPRGISHTTVEGCAKYHRRGYINTTHGICAVGRLIKSIHKTSDCIRLSTHSCTFKNSTKPIKTSAGIKGNHYEFRYHQNFFKRNWGKLDKWANLFSDANKNWFNAVYDPELANRYHQKVSHRIKYNLLRC